MRDSCEYIAVSIVENKESNEENEPDGLTVNGPICDERCDTEDDGLSFVTANSATPTLSSSTENARYRYWFRQTLFPDDFIQVYNITFAEGPFAIKFFKFTILTLLGIWTMFYFVRFMVSSCLGY